MHTIRKVLKWLVAVGLMFIGIFGVMLSLVAIGDPVEFQMANDNDLFGLPPSRMELAGMLLVFIIVGIAGLYLNAWQPKPKSVNP